MYDLKIMKLYEFRGPLQSLPPGEIGPIHYFVSSADAKLLDTVKTLKKY